MGDAFADFFNSYRDIQPMKILATIRVAPTVNTAFNVVTAQMKTGAIFNEGANPGLPVEQWFPLISSQPPRMLSVNKPTTIELDLTKLPPFYSQCFNSKTTNYELATIRFYARGQGSFSVLINLVGIGRMMLQDEWQIVVPSLTHLPDPSTRYHPDLSPSHILNPDAPDFVPDSEPSIAEISQLPDRQDTRLAFPPAKCFAPSFPSQQGSQQC